MAPLTTSSDEDVALSASSSSQLSESGIIRLFNRPNSMGLERQIIERLLGTFSGTNVDIVLWDGKRLGNCAHPDVVMTVHSRQALWKLTLDPVDQLPELYAGGQVDLEGDLLQFLRSINQRVASDGARLHGRSTSGGGQMHLHYRPVLKSVSRGRLPVCDAVMTEFFKPWLDDEMHFSAGEFDSPSSTLEEAQELKCERICAQLQLKPGDVVFDIGCGWGGFGRYAARVHGARVKGWTPQPYQLEYCRERARADGLEDLIETHEGDWDAIRGNADAIVLIESIECTPMEKYGDFGVLVRDCLSDNGRGVLQLVGRNSPQPPETVWIEEHFLPFLQPPALSQLMEFFEFPGLTVRSLNNLNSQYQRTIESWRTRFDDCLDQLEEEIPESLLRAWKLYLASMQAAFETSTMQLYRIGFSKGDWRTSESVSQSAARNAERA